MNLGLVVHPFTDDNLRLASQIGGSDIVYCEINNDDQNTERRFPEVDELRNIRTRVESLGMRLNLLETSQYFGCRINPSRFWSKQGIC